MQNTESDRQVTNETDHTPSLGNDDQNMVSENSLTICSETSEQKREYKRGYDLGIQLK